jgi:hypothetical protein
MTQELSTELRSLRTHIIELWGDNEDPVYITEKKAEALMQLLTSHTPPKTVRVNGDMLSTKLIKRIKSLKPKEKLVDLGGVKVPRSEFQALKSKNLLTTNKQGDYILKQ